MTTKQNTKLHVQQPRQLDKGELDARIEKAIERYKGSHAACQQVDEPILLRYTQKVIELAEQGYTLHPSLPCNAAPGNYSGYMLKPESLQVQEIEKLKADVEEKYKAEIEAFNAEQENILAEQLYQAQVAKERKAAEEKERKAREEAKEEARKYFMTITKEGK